MSTSTCGGIFFSGAATIAFITAILTAVSVVGDLGNFNAVAILIMLGSYLVIVSLFLSCALSVFIAPRNTPPRNVPSYRPVPEPSFEELSRLPDLPLWPAETRPSESRPSESRLPGAVAAAGADSDSDMEWGPSSARVPLLPPRSAPAPSAQAPARAPTPPPTARALPVAEPPSSVAAAAAVTRLSLFTTVIAIIFTFTIVGMGVVDSDADRIAVVCGVSYFAMAMLLANALTVLIATNSSC
jgi:hypothetical protein